LEWISPRPQTLSSGGSSSISNKMITAGSGRS
jgi:hypothetical protein